MLLTIALILGAFLLQRGVEPAPEPAPGELEVSAETRAYLDQVEAICRAHDRVIADAGMVPVARIIRSEAEVTSRIASLPTPAEAREIRRHLIAARRRVDHTSVWMYRVLSRAEHDRRVFRKRVGPVVSRRTARMYQTFGSYGVRCNTDSG